MMHAKIITVSIAVIIIATQAAPLHADSVMTLRIDENTDDAWLVNPSLSPMAIAGYEIISAGGYLAPTGWVSIADAAITRPAEVAAQLGPGALGFFEGDGIGPSFLAEATPDHGTFQPNAPWYIGKPAPAATLQDLHIFYVLLEGGEFLFRQGIVSIIPEPTTISIFALGVLAVLRKHRRQLK
jgi:hypothetical protein